MAGSFNEVVKEAKEHFVVNCKETFVVQEDNRYFYCNLETLNYIVNTLKRNVKVRGSWDYALTTFNAVGKAIRTGQKYIERRF